MQHGYKDHVQKYKSNVVARRNSTAKYMPVIRHTGDRHGGVHKGQTGLWINDNLYKPEWNLPNK